MTDREYVDFLNKCANVPYKDYSWLKDHCYRTLNRPCSPNTRNEHLAILDLIKEHEEKEHEELQWIPVSERLPKESGWYQCTVVVDDSSWTMDLFYKNGIWLDNRRIGMFNTYDIYGYGNTTEKHELSYQELISEFDWTESVIAWMPLPKPYKIEEGRKK